MSRLSEPAVVVQALPVEGSASPGQIVIVVGMRLGCLNHALLTRDAVAAAGLPLAGWIANTIDPDMDGFEDNVEALESRIEAPLLGVLPHGVPAPKAAAHLDVALLP